MLEKLSTLLLQADPNIQLTILEIGASQIEGKAEPFYNLLSLLPGSKVIGFEVDDAVCEQMNAKAETGAQFYPVALGRRSERRTFYVTEHAMCCSLYKPNESLISLYNNLEVAYLKRECEIDTLSLDEFTEIHCIGSIDFIKIDIQGAELDVFMGGTKTLRDTLAIVCEVEFIPHYIDQPLFGDVCDFLLQNDLMFHKFLDFGGRALKPIIFNNDGNAPSQHIWSDAMFIHHVQQIHELTDSQLLKLSLLAAVYGSYDLTYYCLEKYDNRKDTLLATNFLLLAEA
jgi:FkbM family methyltransferase